MRVADLLEGLDIHTTPPGELEVSGIACDSRKVQPGDIFAALVGENMDGRDFIPEAIRNGAVAILAAGSPVPSASRVAWLESPDPRAELGVLAARVFDSPARSLTMAGVTGTNGKSTVVALLAEIFEASGKPTGLVGTLGYGFTDRVVEASHTTPEAPALHRILREMVDGGAACVAMEVSSHALAQGRVAGTVFDLAVFTNLSRDHFDFHGDFESYFNTKRALFDQLKSGGRAVVGIDDRYGRQLAEELPGCMTFGARGQVEVNQAECDLRGIRGSISTPRGDIEFESSLLGQFNLQNILAAVASAEALGVDHSAIARGVSALRPLPGRMEPIEAGQPFPVLIDYAHTDAALRAAITAAKQFTESRVVVVFGCGGDRDPGKRRLMGKAAGELADLAILTSDNPRGEDPLLIIEEVQKGLLERGVEDFLVEPDRAKAIARALEVAGPGWAVLILGKGHEQIQIIGNERLPFSDREEVRNLLEGRVGSGAIG